MNKRVLIIHHAAEYGGGSKGAFLIGKMLKNQGYTVEFLIPDYRDDFYEILLKEGFQVFLYPGLMGGIYWYSGGPKWYSRTFIRNLIRIFQTKRKLKEILSIKSYDFYIVNSSVICWIIKLLEQNKVICFVRENVVNGIWKKIESKYLSRYAKTCFITEYDMEQWPSLKNKSLVYDCVQLTPMNPQGITEIKNVLYLGGDNAIKGWFLMKQLIHQRQDLFFHIAGYVSDNQILQDKNVRFYQMIEDVETLYEKADLVLLPSAIAHQLLPIYEAGLYGKAVITSDFELIHEHIKNGWNGILVPCDSVQAFSKAIDDLQSDIEKANEMILHNYQYMQKHTYNRVMENFIKIINQMKGEV